MHSYHMYRHMQKKKKEKEETEALPERMYSEKRATRRAIELRLSRAHRCKAVNVVQMGSSFHRTHTALGLIPTTSQNQMCVSMIPALRR